MMPENRRPLSIGVKNLKESDEKKSSIVSPGTEKMIKNSCKIPIIDVSKALKKKEVRAS